MLLGLSDDHIQVLFGNFGYLLLIYSYKGFFAKVKNNLGKNGEVQVSFKNSPRHTVGLV